MTKLKSALLCLAAASAAVGIFSNAAAAHPRDRERVIDYFPGIDCRRDHGPAIDTICASDHLKLLEDKITQRYSEAAARANRREFTVLLEDQRLYLADRNACDRDRYCLEKILKARLHAID